MYRVKVLHRCVAVLVRVLPVAAGVVDMDKSTQNILLIGGLAAVAYYFWSKGNSALNSAESSLACWWANLTMGPSVQSQLQGQVIMPCGTSFSTSQLQNMGLQQNGSTGLTTFNYGGQTYQLGSNVCGNYPACPL